MMPKLIVKKIDSADMGNCGIRVRRVTQRSILNQLKGFFSGSDRIFKSASKELRSIKDFQKHWLIFFAEMHYYLAGLFGMIDLLLGKLQHHNVLFAVIADFHNDSFLRGRR